MIDQELVTRKLVLITSDLRELGLIAQTPLADYLASPTHELVVERYLERVIGRMIDINYHLITEGGHAPPTRRPEGACLSWACVGVDELVGLGAQGIRALIDREEKRDEISPVGRVEDALDGAAGRAQPVEWEHRLERLGRAVV